MNIKKNISLFLLMMGVSFSAFCEDIYVITSSESQALPQGNSFTRAGISNSLVSYGCEAYYGGGRKFRGSFTTNSGTLTAQYDKYTNASCSTLKNTKLNIIFRYVLRSECPEGTILNEVTGECEEVPVCEPPAQLDTDTLECVTLPFCERESTWDTIFEAEQSCAAENGIFTYECSDFLESLETRCTQPNACAIGLPNWPQCLDGLDPTEPVTPPNNGFNPDNPDPISPTPPSFEKPEPDPVEPIDSTDTAVLTAIQNLNRDSNEAANALNKDINLGFSDTNNQLATLNSNALALGGSLVDQMNQDFAIYEANKDLALQQTGAINNNGNNLVNAISGQTASLKGSIEGQTSTLEGAIDRLADKIPEPCIPTAENNQCENSHGTTSGYVTDVFSQLSESVDGSISSGHSTILVEAQNAVTTPMTDDVQLVIEEQINMVLNVLPEYDDCTPLAIPSPFGGSFVIPCDFSVKFKTIFSFVIYFLTLNTLVDILFTGITPRAYTVNKG